MTVPPINNGGTGNPSRYPSPPAAARKSFGHALAIPALEEIVQAVYHSRSEPEAPRQSGADLTVGKGTLAHVPHTVHKDAGSCPRDATFPDR
jgi:hypothetical protein